MWTAFSQKLGQLVRNLLPLETAILFLLLGVLVWPIPFIGTISPSLGLVAIYYWSVYRPDLLRPSSVFLLGLLNDALNNFPLGMSSLVYLGVHQLAYAHRRFIAGQIFYMLWFGFVVLAFLAMIISWSVMSLYHNVIMTIAPVLLQFALTVVLFPIPAWLLNRLQRVFLSQG